MPQNLPPNQARTISYSGATFSQIEGWQRRQGAGEGLWLVVYSSTAADGQVWISTQNGIDGASNTIANVPDRRPLAVPCQFYLGSARALAIGVAGAADVCAEIVPSVVTPTREARDVDPCAAPPRRGR